VTDQDLFEYAGQKRAQRQAPLAARMRPRTLDEYIGQEHVVGHGRLLRRAISADQLSSVIFYGPPGTGKTTLATIIANSTRSNFVTLNAVMAGVKDIRKVTKGAKDARDLYGQRTILFVDEVHRWNKAQQDALLPWVESGTIIMIGATIENPWFSMNRALLSRSRVFQLRLLDADDLREVARRALEDDERGYGKLVVDISQDAVDHLVNVANGDARSLLNALQLAVETTEPGPDGVIRVNTSVAEDSIQQRAVLYDREGDYHYDTISAFIKSVRGSDPDAALYWLANMVYAGEDPRFIFRRLLILASEDVGLADPNALRVVESAASAFERIGLPEGQFHMAQATLYLATAPKSNSAMAYFDALEVVKQERTGDVPNHLRDASRDKEGFGHGQGYLYPHAYRDHWVAQQYLPTSLRGRVFYEPSDQGYERDIQQQVQRRREEQLAAMLESGGADAELLTFTPTSREQERWLMRTMTSAAKGFGEIRERLFDGMLVPRHAVSLDLRAGSGLLTWELMRRAPEGGTYALCDTRAITEALAQQAGQLPEMDRPLVMEGSVRDVASVLSAAGHGAVRFDVILGRNTLTREPDKSGVLSRLADLLESGGTLRLAETVPSRTQRLYALVDRGALGDAGLAEAWVEAEEGIYQAQDDPMVNWDVDALERCLLDTELADAQVSVHVTEARDTHIMDVHLDRWWSPSTTARPSYGDHMRLALGQSAAHVLSTLRSQLLGQVVSWSRSTAYVHGVRR